MPRLTLPASLRSPTRTVRPLRTTKAATANAAALPALEAAILEHSDGSRSLFELADAVRAQLAGDDAGQLVQLTSTLMWLEGEDWIEPSCVPHPALKFALGIEDRPAFHWQLAILLESLHAQLPRNWEVLPVVCNDGAPLSASLQRVLDAYGVRALRGRDLPNRHSIDFASGSESYPPLNRIEALAVAAERVRDDDLLCLMDSDNFLYRELDIGAFPSSDAVCANWLIEQERFFSTSELESGVVGLQALLDAVGVEQRFRPGGVTVFTKGSTARRAGFAEDCLRFTQVLYLLGRIGRAGKIWHAEMPSVALALTTHGVPYEVIDPAGRHFVISKPREIAPGAFYHYYGDLADNGVEGAFFHSRWSKQDYRDRNLLEDDLGALAARAETDHEHFFFQLARRAQQRLGLGNG